MGLGSLLTLVPDLSQKLARVHIIPLAPDGSVDTDIGDKGLPFWPETIADTKGAEWASKPIPGGSHPLYQWIQGTERVISFTIILSRDSQDVDPTQERDDVHNVDVAAAIAWLRSMEYPRYEQGGGSVRPPPLVSLVFPGSEISGVIGVHELLCIMTQCDVEYQKFFNDGTPRHATVQVSFAEVVQDPTGIVQFVGRDLFTDLSKRYKMDPEPGTS